MAKNNLLFLVERGDANECEDRQGGKKSHDGLFPQKDLKHEERLWRQH